MCPSIFPPLKFNAGASLRDTSFPQVNFAYIREVLSVSNLAAARGAPVTISDEVMSEQQRAIDAYATAGEGFRKFYFAFRLSAETSYDETDDATDGVVDAVEIVSHGVRRLFKLGKALNVPRGAPG